MNEKCVAEPEESLAAEPEESLAEANIPYEGMSVKEHFPTSNASSNYSFISPYLVLDYKKELKRSKKHKSCHTQGCKWSPEGSCFLVASSDRRLRIFDLPPNVSNGEFNDEAWVMGGWEKDVKASTVIRESEYVYDYEWYPLMQPEDSNSSCFAVTCRGLPIHLWDKTSGQLICSYIHHNHLDQLIAAHSIAFSPDGMKLVGGYSKGIREFDVERPGRESTEISIQDQPGIISTMEFHPVLHNVLAAGSFRGSVGLYSTNTKQAFAIFESHKKGVTYLQFSPDGTKLFSGTRKDDDIFCWDMRNPGEVLAIFQRKPTTNQRMYFDITPSDNRYLLSGTTEGEVLIWDINSVDCAQKSDFGETFSSFSFKAHLDCVNGLSVHPTKPLLLTSSGQRVIPQFGNSDNSDSEDELLADRCASENSVKLWYIG